MLVKACLGAGRLSVLLNAVHLIRPRARAHVHMHTHVCTHAHMHARARTCTHTHMHTHGIRVLTRVHTCMRAHTHKALRFSFWCDATCLPLGTPCEAATAVTVRALSRTLPAASHGVALLRRFSATPSPVLASEPPSGTPVDPSITGSIVLAEGSEATLRRTPAESPEPQHPNLGTSFTRTPAFAFPCLSSLT